MEESKRKKRNARMRRKYVNIKKHQHPNASFSQLWSEAWEKYPE